MISLNSLLGNFGRFDMVLGSGNPSLLMLIASVSAREAFLLAPLLPITGDAAVDPVRDPPLCVRSCCFMLSFRVKALLHVGQRMFFSPVCFLRGRAAGAEGVMGAGPEKRAAWGHGYFFFAPGVLVAEAGAALLEVVMGVVGSVFIVTPEDGEVPLERGGSAVVDGWYFWREFWVSDGFSEKVWF